MKFSVVLALVAAATVVSAADTNRARLARGLGPMTPAKRSSKSDGAWGSKPSSKPSNHKCSAENTYCCNTHGTSEQSSEVYNLLSAASLLDKVAPNVQVWGDCTSLGGSSCSAAVACCDNDKFHSGFSLINMNCNTIQL